MKKVAPYKTVKGAISALDNGGRFYNLASKANDGNITQAELAKAAGILSGSRSLMIYLEMSLMNLETDARNKVLLHLSDELKVKYHKYKPTQFLPAKAREEGIVGSAAIITGIPRLIDSKTQFTGFIMIPITTGNTTTFTMIPIFDQYDVYELQDRETKKEFIIAHGRSRYKLPEEPMRCGGIIKELKSNREEREASNKFLEMTHYAFLS